jgi:iron complex outermembrane recepter protein
MKGSYIKVISLLIGLIVLPAAAKNVELEEILVTAENREQSLQKTPIAISVLTEADLVNWRVSSLRDLSEGGIPSLNIIPFFNDPGTLSVAIRGFSGVDVAQTTRKSAATITLDKIELPHPQSYGIEVADLQRIEVLRGPQSTLFGSNATGGAIHMVSKKPSGEFDFSQSAGLSNFDGLKTVSHINIPETSGISAKLSYLHREQDGWVTNPGGLDLNAVDADAVRLDMLAKPKENLEIRYVYNETDSEFTQNYYQVHEDYLGILGEERDRVDKTRDLISPIEPTISRQRGHSVTVTWQLKNSTFESLSSYTFLNNKSRSNYGGALYFDGFLEPIDIESDHYTQEFRIHNSGERIQWQAGVYLSRETVDEAVGTLFSLDMTTVPVTHIDPNSFGIPVRMVVSDLKSQAIYGQATWTPDILQDNLHFTAGLRYTEEQRSGTRTQGTAIDVYDQRILNTDPSFTVVWDIDDDVSIYAKASTAFRSGGVNSRSESFAPYDKENVENYEFGLKSEWLDRRLRANVVIFNSEISDGIIDVQDPLDISHVESYSAEHDISVDGVEGDLNYLIVDGVEFALSYTYLDADMPDQPNPLAGNALEPFVVSQAPKHSGSISIDYQISQWHSGWLGVHLSAVAKDGFFFLQKSPAKPDAYHLINARVYLDNMQLGDGDLSISLWGRNLTDEEYAVHGTFFEGLSSTRVYGDPRTYGVDVTYRF